MSFQKTIEDFDAYSDKFNLEFKGVNIWPYFRLYSLDKLHFKKDRKVKVGGLKALSLLKNLIYGFLFWFRKYDALVFMASSDRRMFEGKWAEKTDFLPKYIGATLFVELPNKGHYSRSEVPNKEVVSKISLLLIEKILEKFIRVPNEVKILGAQTDSHFNIESNLEVIYKQFISRYLVTHFFGKRFGIKTAVVDAAYVDMPRVMALKKLGVRVIEMQHGNINMEHHGYQLFNKTSSLLLPDYFLSFGTKEIEFFKNSSYIDIKKVFPVGSFYLEYISNASPHSNSLLHIKKDHKVLIAATGQDAYDDEFIPFIIDVLEKKTNWACIFIPRTENESYYRKRYKFPRNLFFIKDLNTYEIIKMCDIHTTVNSTCAIESVAIGTPNVLYDFNGKARAYLEHLLENKETNSFCENSSSFIEEIEKKYKLESEIVSKLNSKIFTPCFSENLELFFKTVFFEKVSK